MTQTETSELKPCPFCGNEHMFYEQLDRYNWSIKCGNCSSRMMHFENRDLAARGWNTRPTEDYLSAENELLQKRLNSAARLDANSAEDFDWCVLDKEWQLLDLRARLKKAVEEIKEFTYSKTDDGKIRIMSQGEKCISILGKHGLLEEDYK